MQNFNDYAAAAATYVAALLALFVEHSSTIVQVLGFILLVARLVQEVPRAFTVITKTFSKTVTETDEGIKVVKTVETVVEKKRG